MWECKYGKEPLNTRLFVLQLIRKLPVILFAGLLGALLVGGPYFLVKVTFGPAKEYEAVTDFYVDYAVKEDGTQHTYINFATWDQLLHDDVFTDKILVYLAEENENAARTDAETEEIETLWNVPLKEREKAAGITKEELKEYLYATVLSDLRIVTTTVTTGVPELTMKIERALVKAMFDFGEEQKEIGELRILQEPEQASLVAADVRTFRACMVGAVSFVFVTVLYLCLYYALDEGIHVPETFERRFGIPMLGTIRSEELPVLARKLLPDKAAILTADKGIDFEQAKKTLTERGIKAEKIFRLEELMEAVQTEENGTELNAFESLSGRELLLLVKANAHNGKQIEKTLDLCGKCGMNVSAALLWDADERLIRAYEIPEHVFYAWRRVRSGDKV